MNAQKSKARKVDEWARGGRGKKGSSSSTIAWRSESTTANGETAAGGDEPGNWEIYYTGEKREVARGGGGGAAVHVTGERALAGGEGEKDLCL